MRGPTTPTSTRTLKHLDVKVVTPDVTPNNPRSIRTPSSSSPTTGGGVRKLRMRHQRHDSQDTSDSMIITAQDWYEQGERVWYDPAAKKIVAYKEPLEDLDEVDEDAETAVALAAPVTPSPKCGSPVQVFFRVVLPERQNEEEEEDNELPADGSLDLPLLPLPVSPNSDRWMTFLPNDPEGSYGFSQVEEAIMCGSTRGRCDTDSTGMSAASLDGCSQSREDIPGTATTLTATESMPVPCDPASPYRLDGAAGLARLYLDYLGQGDSDNLNKDAITCPSSCTNAANTAEEHYRDKSIHADFTADDSFVPRAGGGNRQRASTSGGRLETESYFEQQSNTSSSKKSSEEKKTPSVSITKQRADLVEAHWRSQGIKRTVVVSAGDSSLVVMELLQRQRARLAAGTPFPKILHVLSLNGRYVAKTRHTSQLPTVTQILRSERMGPSLAAKAQRSDFTLSQCLQPFLKGCKSKHIRKEVAQVVRRNNGASSLVDMARTVDDHLADTHRYQWNLPRLFHNFGMNQGITLQLATTNRSANRQVQLVEEQLQEYHQAENSCKENWRNGLRHEEFHKSHVTSTAFLLDSSPKQLEPFLQAIERLANEDIPLSNGAAVNSTEACCASSFEDDEDRRESANDVDVGGDDDSWLGSDAAALEEEELLMNQSHDTRLETEIVFDANLMDGDDFDIF